MFRLLVVAPLRLDEIAPDVLDPPEQVLDLFLRRPAAVISTLAAVAVDRAVDAVVLLEPVCGSRDGGYAQRCLAELHEDLDRRRISVAPLVTGEVAYDVIRADGVGGVELRRSTGWSKLVLEDGHGAVVATGPDVTVDAVLIDPVARDTIAVHLDGAASPDAVIDGLVNAARRAAEGHVERFVLAIGELTADAGTRRMLRWPGLAERALRDVRHGTGRAGLSLWWNELRVAPSRRPTALFPGGPVVGDPLVMDLLGLPVGVDGEHRAAPKFGHADTTRTFEAGELRRRLSADEQDQVLGNAAGLVVIHGGKVDTTVLATALTAHRSPGDPGADRLSSGWSCRRPRLLVAGDVVDLAAPAGREWADATPTAALAGEWIGNVDIVATALAAATSDVGETAATAPRPYQPPREDRTPDGSRPGGAMAPTPPQPETGTHRGRRLHAAQRAFPVLVAGIIVLVGLSLTLMVSGLSVAAAPVAALAAAMALAVLLAPPDPAAAPRWPGVAGLARVLVAHHDLDDADRRPANDEAWSPVAALGAAHADADRKRLEQALAERNAMRMAAGGESSDPAVDWAALLETRRRLMRSAVAQRQAQTRERRLGAERAAIVELHRLRRELIEHQSAEVLRFASPFISPIDGERYLGLSYAGEWSVVTNDGRRRLAAVAPADQHALGLAAALSALHGGVDGVGAVLDHVLDGFDEPSLGAVCEMLSTLSSERQLLVLTNSDTVRCALQRT